MSHNTLLVLDQVAGQGLCGKALVDLLRHLVEGRVAETAFEGAN